MSSSKWDKYAVEPANKWDKYAVEEKQDTTIPTVELTPKEAGVVNEQEYARNNYVEEATKKLFDQPQYQNPKAREAYYTQLSTKGYDKKKLQEIGERYVNSKAQLPELMKDQSPEGLYRTATALSDLGKYEDASSIYTDLITRGAQSPEIFDGLAYAQEKLGDIDAAYKIRQEGNKYRGEVYAAPIDKLNPSAQEMGMIAGALEQFTPAYSQGKNLVEGTKDALKQLKESGQLFSEGKIGRGALRGAVGTASGVINYAMNTTPIGLGFVEASHGFTGQGVGALASKASGDYLTPEEATSALGSPLSGGLQIYENKTGKKVDEGLKDAVMLGELVLMGYAGHKLSKVKPSTQKSFVEANTTADKILNGEATTVEEVRNLNQVIYKNKEFRESVLNPYNEKAWAAKEKADKLQKTIQDNPVVAPILQPELDKALEQVNVNEAKALEHEMKPADEAAQHEVLRDEKEQLQNSLTPETEEYHDKINARIAEIDAQLPKESVEEPPIDKSEAEIIQPETKIEPLSETDKQKISPETEIIETGVSGSALKDVESTAKALEIESKNKPTIWEQVKQFIKDTAKKVGNKLGIISNEQHLSNFEKAKADWDKLSSREKKLKRADYELDDLHHTEGGYYKVGDSLIDLDLNASHLKLLLENNKFLNILNKLGVNKIHGENRPPEEMFAHYSDNKIHLNNNSAFENIRQVTNAMSHELGHHEWTKLTKEERDYVRSLPIETGMAKHYEAQEKNGGKQTSASLQEENFADYVMQYFQGKLYGDESLLNKIPTKLREMFDNKYSDLLKDNEHSEVAEAYHKAKADGTNPELVKAVEDLLGKAPTQYTEAAGGSALKDVEAKKADIERRRVKELEVERDEKLSQIKDEPVSEGDRTELDKEILAKQSKQNELDAKIAEIEKQVDKTISDLDAASKEHNDLADQILADEPLSNQEREIANSEKSKTDTVEQHIKKSFRQYLKGLYNGGLVDLFKKIKDKFRKALLAINMTAIMVTHYTGNLGFNEYVNLAKNYSERHLEVNPDGSFQTVTLNATDNKLEDNSGVNKTPYKSGYVTNQIINLEGNKFEARNRNDKAPVENAVGITTNLLKPFQEVDGFKGTLPRKDEATKQNPPVIAFNKKTGEVKAGNLKDFDKDWQVSETFTIPLDFKLDTNGKLKTVYHGQVMRNVPVTTINGKEVPFPIGLDTKDKAVDPTKHNTFGVLEGGKVILTVGDYQVQVNGGFADIYQAWKQLKENNPNKEITAYLLDNGSYNLPILKDDGVVTTEDLNKHILRNKDGGTSLVLKQKIPQEAANFPHGYQKIETNNFRKDNAGNKVQNKPTVIVLHHTGEYKGGEKDVIKEFTAPKGNSSHYLIGKDGKIYQFNDGSYVMFHAGESSFKGKEDLNSSSIGIEVQGDSRTGDFTKQQYESLTTLVYQLAKNYSIPIENVVDHKTIRDNYLKAHPEDKVTKEKVDLDDAVMKKIVAELQKSYPQVAKQERESHDTTKEKDTKKEIPLSTPLEVLAGLQGLDLAIRAYRRRKANKASKNKTEPIIEPPMITKKLIDNPNKQVVLSKIEDYKKELQQHRNELEKLKEESSSNKKDIEVYQKQIDDLISKADDILSKNKANESERNKIRSEYDAKIKAAKAPTQYTEAATPAKKESGGVSGSALKDVDFTAKGGNKIVDEKGEPITLLHGTNNDKIKFDEGTVFYATSDKQFADVYGENHLPVQISLKNPYDLTESADGVIKDRNGEPMLDSEGKPYSINYIDQSVVKDLKERGYDGVRMGNESVVAFDKSQVKAPTQYTEAAGSSALKDALNVVPEELKPDVQKRIDELKAQESDIEIKEEIVEPIKIETNEEQKNNQEVGQENVLAEQGKKSLANRVYEGNTPEEIKASVEKNGLTYDIEKQDVAEQNAIAFMEEVGTDNALKAVRNGEVSNAAETFIFGKAIDDVYKEGLLETDPARKQELLTKEAELIKELDERLRSKGRAISAANAVYQTSDLGYKLGSIINRAVEANQGELPKEVVDKLTDLSAKLDEANRKLEELKRSKKDPDLIIKEPVKRQSLSPEKLTRKLELRKKYSGVFNDVTNIPRLIAEKEFREYAGLVLEEMAGDFKAFSTEMINTVGKGIREHLPKLYKDLGGKENPEMARISAGLKKSIAEYERKLKEKDFASKKRGKPELDAETFDLLVERNKLKDKVDLEIEKLKLKNRTTTQKLKDGFVDVLNLPKSLIASADMSAPLRQGAILSFKNPKIAAKSAVEMFRQAFSEDKAVDWLTRLKSSPEYARMKDAGLYFAEPTAKLSAKEEQFISNIAHKIPIWGRVVKGSERAYSGYLNKLRADVFTAFEDALVSEGFKGEQLDTELKSFADFVNNATGRGSLGRFEESTAVLNAAFFSPRYAISRFNLLSPVKYAKMSPRARAEALKSVGTYIGLGSIVLALAKAGGAEVGTDFRSADAGKIKVGDTRFDIWAGFQQWVRLITQVAKGEKVTIGGKTIDLSKEGYGKDSRLDVLGRFARSKASPTAGLLMDVLDGEDMLGNPVTFKFNDLESFAKSKEGQLIIPLYLQDIKKTIDSENKGVAAASIPASFFGVGVQTYSAEEPKTPWEISNKFKGDKEKITQALIDNIEEEKEIPTIKSGKQVRDDSTGKVVKVKLSESQIKGLKAAKEKAIKLFMSKYYRSNLTNEQFETKISDVISKAKQEYLKKQNLKP